MDEKFKKRVIIVNEKDEQIALKERKDIKKEEIYRVSALWITNSKGEILLAQRGLNKKHDPGKWAQQLQELTKKEKLMKSI